MASTRTHKGANLLQAVERLMEDPEELISRTEVFLRAAGERAGAAPVDSRAAAARLVIGSYAARSAATGALAALPALLPGPGMLVAALAGTFVDIALMLKHEVEMSLCLAHLCGFDIADREQRRKVLLLTSLRVSEVQAGGNFLLDLAVAEMDAIVAYTPRQLAKVLASVLTRLALRATSRVSLRIVPVVGVVACGLMNRWFTREVGRRCWVTLAQCSSRNSALGRENQGVIDATFQR
jgi:hypothetical protein